MGIAIAAVRAPLTAVSRSIKPLAAVPTTKAARSPSCCRRSCAVLPSKGPLKARLRTAMTAHSNSSCVMLTVLLAEMTSYALLNASRCFATAALRGGYSSNAKSASLHCKGIVGNSAGNVWIHGCKLEPGPFFFSLMSSNASCAHHGSLRQPASLMRSSLGHGPPVVTTKACSAGTLRMASSLSMSSEARIPRSSPPKPSRNVCSSTFAASMPNGDAQWRQSASCPTSAACATDVVAAQ
mmetsp:Transcript_34249/g.79996  ORF Transcript_34249/g.79996 Transcript_34249/m.79996 type:complete len:239 (-) Transcript_34249:367-1083(-)